MKLKNWIFEKNGLILNRNVTCFFQGDQEGFNGFLTHAHRTRAFARVYFLTVPIFREVSITLLCTEAAPSKGAAQD